MDLSNKTCTVVDNGLFVELAIRLAREDGFGKVNYYAGYQCAFPRWNEYDIGRGFKGVTRLDHPLQAFDTTDLWVFPDTYHRHLAKFLRDVGERVWAACDAEELELDREHGLDVMKEAGIGVPKTVIVVGVEALKKELKNHEVAYIKNSFTRGDGETWKHEDYKQSLRHIDAKVVPLLGVNKEERKFLIVEPIDPAVEIGGDQLTVDGQPFDHALYGYEVKDRAYVGAFKPYEKLPAVIMDYDRRIATFMAKCQARTFASSELRVVKRAVAFAIDPCLRLPNPPFQAMIEAYGNLPELIYAGAEGEVLPVEVVDPYWCILMLESEEANESWTPLKVPKELRQWVKLQFCCEVAGELGVIPQSQRLPLLGGAVGHGKTIEAAFEMARDVADEVKVFGLVSHGREWETAKDYIKEGEALGIAF